MRTPTKTVTELCKQNLRSYDQNTLFNASHLPPRTNTKINWMLNEAYLQKNICIFT